MQKSIVIQKNPSLNDSSNYELLRKKGLEYIEQLGSAYWTDYNIHDPGITILELLCYAITDLGYRTSLDMKDLLAEPPSESSDNWMKKQAFFLARDILTINPLTIADLRKLLIDIEGVKNAWLRIITGSCGNIPLYARCADSSLQYVHQKGTPHPVVIKGFYDVLLEFDNEDGVGDLNSGKVKYTFSFETTEGMQTALIEMRLPTWQQVQDDASVYKTFNTKNNTVNGVTVNLISHEKNALANIANDQLANKIRKPLYANILVEYVQPDDLLEDNVLFINVPFSVWFRNEAARRQITRQQLVSAIEDNTASGIFGKYLSLLQRATVVMDVSKMALYNHRNLCEDYCKIYPVQVQEFAVCADMEIEPLADIEAVLAEAFYQIDQYMSADIKFYSLKQLIEEGVPVDEIFEGPSLSCGFIKNDELESTNLKQYIYSSDIINKLMDIPGVINIKNFMLSKYDTAGNIIQTHEWAMQVQSGQQPRFYPEASKILVFKNGLPFLPDRTELADTLQVIKGKYAQPKYTEADNNLPIPQGKYYDLGDYSPLQYSLPLTYGVGYAGLPASATNERKAQAKQLKAYLMFFEQLLANYFEQLANVKSLFAVDAEQQRSNFSKWLGNEEIKDIEEIYNDLGADNLDALNENEIIGLNRRNRFLDHILARFSEQFNDYALMLYSFVTSRALADEALLENKAAFIKDYPKTSSQRAKAYNYKDGSLVCNNTNASGLAIRIKRLLGIKSFEEHFKTIKVKNGDVIELHWSLQDDAKRKYLISTVFFTKDADLKAAMEEEIIAVRTNIADTLKYTIVKDVKWKVLLKDAAGNIIAAGAEEFRTEDEAITFKDSLILLAENILHAEQLYVVEHILLRPRNKSVARFQLYEEIDDGTTPNELPFERRWRFIDDRNRIYLSASTRYDDLTVEEAEAKARQEIAVVCKYFTTPERYHIRKVKKWVLNLTDETGEVIATRKQHFASKADAERARDQIIAFAQDAIFYDEEFSPSRKPGDIFSVGDPLLSICIPPDCGFCESDADPYSFRLTVVLSGESGITEKGLEFRRFAEQTIRKETPAHLGVKVCWVSDMQLDLFKKAYCAWQAVLALEKPDAIDLHLALKALLEVFEQLKNVYPEATLHDCIDGNDANRVFLGHTAIIDDKKLDDRLKNNI